MLGLSASGIASYNNDASLNLAAVTHRLKSIQALNSAVVKGLSSSEQGNAMLATCFCLLFQSTLINDALGEYMAFIRGCIEIGIQMKTRQYQFLFTKLFGDEQLKEIDHALYQAPLIEPHIVSAACRSLEKMEPLCKTKVEKEMYALLLAMARNLVTSSRDGTLIVQ